ncbi:MAG: carboxylesterase family protein [Firmicutes bacterium]|nr:carboxylesterase family protein [Bacillota bacterium]
MKENIIIVNCKVASEAYQILSMLRQDHEEDGFSVSHAAVVKMDNGDISLEDGFVAGDAVSGHGWKGGLIGSLVGLLGGPLGVLFGGSVGSIIGSSMDMDELKDKSVLMGKAGECLVDGETALLLMVREENENALEKKLKDFQVSVTEMDAAEIASEIDNVKEEKSKTILETIKDFANEVLGKVADQHDTNKKIAGDYDKSLAVKCVNGTFVGKKTENVISYKGIPFVGEQPVGDLRWKAPVDFAEDDGVYEAYYNAKSACQNEEMSDYQGEDCLYLNIWKTDEAPAEKKPVMVWIHGGAYMAGGTGVPLFDCHDFMKENPDVIVVTVAYRLGVLGFLHLSHLSDGKDYKDSQNLGLLDQMMALKWVHENISGFGGDPDNVTIWGESAGAGSCTMLPLIESSHQYFKRVIAQSGAPTQTISPEESIVCTSDLMDALGCKTVEDLKKVDSKKLVEASAILTVRLFPERDGYILPSDPLEAYENGAAKDIAFLQGCNKDEMNFFVSVLGETDFKLWADDRKANKFDKQLTDEEKALVEEFCKEGQTESWAPDSRLFSQSWFIAPAVRLTENQTKAGGKSYTYFYRVESSAPILKSAHGEELPIVFKHPEMTDVRPYDETFSKTMRKMWVQFAKTGDPSLTAEQSPDGKAKNWPLYDMENKTVMVLDEFDIHTEKETDIKIVDRERSYFLTKYYML